MEKTLKQVRKELRLTQNEAAGLLGVSRRSYQHYENNQQAKSTIKYRYMLEELLSILQDENQGTLSLEDIKRGCHLVFSKYDVTYCYLFGSYAKSKAKDDSDVDLLISSEVKGLKFFGMIEELRETLHKKIDVIGFEQLVDNKQLLHEVLKDGIKIYERDQG